MLTTEKPSGVARRVAAAARSFVVGLDRTPGANAPKPPNALAPEAPRVHACAKQKKNRIAKSMLLASELHELPGVDTGGSTREAF